MATVNDGGAKATAGQPKPIAFEMARWPMALALDFGKIKHYLCVPSTCEGSQLVKNACAVQTCGIVMDAIVVTSVTIVTTVTSRSDERYNSNNTHQCSGVTISKAILSSNNTFSYLYARDRHL